MEHRGVEYRIIQGIQRGIWKWSVETEPGTKSGISDSKDAAMAAAKATENYLARFGAHGWALQRALSRQSMPLGLEARNGRAVHNYGNGPGTTRPAFGLNRPSWRGVG